MITALVGIGAFFAGIIVGAAVARRGITIKAGTGVFEIQAGSVKEMQCVIEALKASNVETFKGMVQ